MISSSKKKNTPTPRQNWRPDWKDKSQYPSLKETKDFQWAWEFLRRNPEYQRFWQKHGTKRSGDIFKEKFGLITPPPPPSRNIKHRLDLVFSHLAVGTQRKSVHAEKPLQLTGELADGEVIIRFNLSFPLKPQLARARKVLEKDAMYLQGKGAPEKTIHRNRREHYSRYLRILDAIESGAKTEEIAKEIYPNIKNTYPERRASKKVDDDIRAAKALRDKGYLYIAS